MLFDRPLRLGWLFLDLNSYFASVEQQLNPQLRGKPIIVVPLDTDATSAIAASYEAKAYGIRTGTKVYDAKRMCPGLICVKANHEHYVRFHHMILEEIDRHIPVSVVASIDEMACELDVSEQEPEAAVALAHRIKQGISHCVGEVIRCSIGIAPNRFLAKIATDMQKPDGLVVILPQDIPQKLFSLSVGDVPGIGKSMQYRLYKAGISSMEQLYQLQPKQMRGLWHSVEGERMWYKLRGVELESEPSQRRTVGHSHVLSPENRPPDKAKLVCQRLMLKAVSRMRRLGYTATILTLSIRCESGAKYVRELRFRPLDTHMQIQPFWEECWLVACHPSVKRVKKVSVTLHGLVAKAAVQSDLFDIADIGQQPKNGMRQEALSAAMDQLNQKYGRGTVITAASLGEANHVTGTKIAFSRIPDVEEFRE